MKKHFYKFLFRPCLLQAGLTGLDFLDFTIVYKYSVPTGQLMTTLFSECHKTFRIYFVPLGTRYL